MAWVRGTLPAWHRSLISSHHCCLQCHTYIGTVTYMSPERINSQPYSFPADIWCVPSDLHSI